MLAKMMRVVDDNISREDYEQLFETNGGYRRGGSNSSGR